MKRGWILAIIAANLAGLTALVFVYPHLMVAPGPLIPAHAALATDCFACHAPLRGAVAERCITCHAVASIGLRTTAGAPIDRTPPRVPFHQGLSAPDCLACHSDHPGSRWTRPSQPAFSHALLAPAARETCATCHTPPSNDIHRALTTTCTQCHDQTHWKPAIFDHAKHFQLDGDHNVACVTCHVGGNLRSYTCFGCHEHQPDRIRAKHEKEGIRDFTNCVACHRNAHDEPRERGSREGGERSRERKGHD